MEDKFTEGLINTSVEIMKKLSQGGTLTSDELKFIILTKQMSDKAKGAKGPLDSILNSVKPILPLVGALFDL